MGWPFDYGGYRHDHDWQKTIMTSGNGKGFDGSPLSRLAHRLTNPWLVVLGTILGAGLGVLWPEAGQTLQPVGRFYVSVLSICILPIILTALIGGTGSMLRNPTLRPMFRRFALVYVLLLLVPAAIALIVGLMMRPRRQCQP